MRVGFPPEQTRPECPFLFSAYNTYNVVIQSVIGRIRPRTAPMHTVEKKKNREKTTQSCDWRFDWQYVFFLLKLSYKREGGKKGSITSRERSGSKSSFWRFVWRVCKRWWVKKKQFWARILCGILWFFFFHDL